MHRHKVKHGKLRQKTSPICELFQRRDNPAVSFYLDEDEVFAAIEETWDEINQDTIDCLMGSFRARCEVCVELGRESLHGH
jgi:hypothetical protein